MYYRSIFSLSCFFLLFALSTVPLSASTRTWNGGDGNWDTVTSNWLGGTKWNNATPDNAVFSSPGGNLITLTENITAGTVTFQTDNNELISAAGRSLTFNSLIFSNNSLATFISGGLALNPNPNAFSSNGELFFFGTSALNASTANAVNNGTQAFLEFSSLNATAANAISGGEQIFSDSSSLNVNASNAISGALLQFSGTSALNANAADVFGSSYDLNFIETSALNANVASSVSNGTQNFHGGMLNANAANSVSGGTQIFNSIGTFNANVTNAVNNNTIVLDNNSFAQINASNALTSTVVINFEASISAPSGTLRLNGNSTSVGQINSLSAGLGEIENTSVNAATLTVGNALNSNFSGVIQDGVGGGTLALVKTGSGILTLAGNNNTYTGGTDVNGGALMANNTSGSATGTGNVNVGINGTLGGNGIIAGNTTIIGTLAPKTIPLGGGTLRFDNDLSLQSTSTVIMQLSGILLSEYDKIDANNFMMDGVLQLQFFGGFVATQGNSFKIFNWNTQSGAFTSLALPQLDPGLGWDASELYTTGTLTVVPEPLSWHLLVLAFIGFGVILALHRRRADI